MADLDDTSVYPFEIDGYSTLPLRRNLVHEIRAEDHNRLRNAIVKIQQELGAKPAGTFTTVAARLDDIGDVRTLLVAHMEDPTDAHDASAISVLDSDDNYFEDDVESVLEELATLLPPSPDVIGDDNSKVPNSGIPSFVDGYGVKHVFNVSTSNPNIVKKTQPDQINGVKGLYIIDVSDSTPNGTGTLEQSVGDPATFRWKAPGDSSFGVAVNLASLDDGDVATLESSTTTKRIRVAKSQFPYGNVTVSEDFEIFGMDAVPGYYSLPSEGFKFTQNITRTAISSTETSRLQFMIKGNVFPADRGTLVLQRKLRGTSSFYPVAVLDLEDNFDNTKRATGQPVYTPSFSAFDHFVLFDRLPVSADYSEFGLTANNTNAYDNYENTFTRMQVAKYLVPVSVPVTDVVGGTLEAPENITQSELDDTISAYRIYHYRPGITTFTGTPDQSEIFSTQDPYSALNDGDTGMRFSNLIVDSSATRPGIEHVNIKPTNVNVPSDDATSFIRRSGVRFYNSTSSDLFDIEVRTDNNVFGNTYVKDDILRFDTQYFNFPSGTDAGGYGASVDIEELFDGDGYLSANKYSTTNLPAFGDQAFYIINSTVNSGRRPTPNPNVFTARAHIKCRLYDPFGPGDGYDAYGYDGSNRILINTYSVSRATSDTEYFTDESKRVGTSELFNFNLDSNQFTAEFGANGDGYTLIAWNANIALVPGMLQCGARFTSDESNIPGLIFPQDNYREDGANGILPHQPSGSNEIGQSTAYNDPTFQVDSFYQRVFTLGYPIDSGKLQIVSGGNNLIDFDDIKATNAYRFGKIELKIPGNDTNSTGWMDLGKLFQPGKYEDGDGCLSGAVIGSEGNITLPFTFGGRNNANTGNMIAVRVTYFGPMFEDAKTRIITMIKLLP